MENKSEISFIKKVENIPIYRDPYMEKDKFIVGYQSLPILDPGYIFVPMDKWNEGMINAKSAIEKDEVDEILKEKINRKFSDIKFILCNLTNEEDLNKLINSLYKNFK